MNANTLWRGSWVQRLRLISGLILFVFAATHFINHALGLVSLEAMSAFDDWRFTINRSVPGTIVLASALLTHVGLACRRLVRRRTLRLPVWEWVQIALGFSIPVLLLPHIVNTRVAATFFGVYDTYPYELARIWPSAMAQQSVLLLIVWIHGCMGLHFWLRLTDRYRRFAPSLLALAVLLPFAALAGVSVQGRAVAAAIEQPGGLAKLQEETRWPDASATETLEAVKLRTEWAYGLLFLGVVVAGAAGFALARRSRRIVIRYAGGPEVRTEAGPTLLELSRRHGIAHLSVCGGRGRCSTCRVLVLEGMDVPPPSEAELRTLKTIGAGPNVRLACQLRPTGPMTVLRMLKTGAAAQPPHSARDGASDGIERELAVLFVDMRGFTTLTESRLPFDVIYILNQFFGTVGQPVHDQGGWITNYAGDGMIALFGEKAGLGATCRAALIATAEIDRAMSALNERLAGEMRQPLRVAMGLHAGTHVMGRVGYGESPAMSVIGLAMNVASRLETMAKGAGVQLAVSKTVTDYAGLDTSDLRTESTAVRGLSAPIDVVFVEAARELPARLKELAPG